MCGVDVAVALWALTMCGVEMGVGVTDRALTLYTCGNDYAVDLSIRKCGVVRVPLRLCGQWLLCGRFAFALMRGVVDVAASYCVGSVTSRMEREQQ